MELQKIQTDLENIVGVTIPLEVLQQLFDQLGVKPEHISTDKEGYKEDLLFLSGKYIELYNPLAQQIQSELNDLDSVVHELKTSLNLKGIETKDEILQALDQLRLTVFSPLKINEVYTEDILVRSYDLKETSKNLQAIEHIFDTRKTNENLKLILIFTICLFSLIGIVSMFVNLVDNTPNINRTLNRIQLEQQRDLY